MRLRWSPRCPSSGRLLCVPPTMPGSYLPVIVRLTEYQLHDFVGVSGSDRLHRGLCAESLGGDTGAGALSPRGGPSAHPVAMSLQTKQLFGLCPTFAHFIPPRQGPQDTGAMRRPAAPEGGPVLPHFLGQGCRPQNLRAPATAPLGSGPGRAEHGPSGGTGGQRSHKQPWQLEAHDRDISPRESRALGRARTGTQGLGVP